MVYINAISYHLPDLAYNNDQIIEDYYQNGGDRDIDITAQDIYNQCGVKRRYSSHPDETAKDLGNAAANKLFDEWRINKKEIEYIIFVSDALEYKGPTTACIMQNNLDLENGVGAIDVLHGCTGWIYGLSLAKALISSKQVSNVLVITADTPTKVVHPKDIELRAIFSDAGAATLISNKKIDNGINTLISDFIFGTDGKGEKNLYTSRSATKDPADIAWLSQFKNISGGMTRGRLIMNSPQIFLFALRKVPLLIEEVLIKNNIKFDEIDYFIFHQANGKMLEFIRNRLKIPKEKFITNIEGIGNTVAATIPIAFYDAIKGHNFKIGDKILVAGFGIGYSWGATIIAY